MPHRSLFACSLVVASAMAACAPGYGARDPDDRQYTPAENKESARYVREGLELQGEFLDRAYALECKPHSDRERCGLVFEEVTSKKFMRRFVEEVCGLEPGESELPEACHEQFRRMYFARIAERYDRVSAQELEQHCDAYPIESRDLKKLETWMLMKHNEVLLAELSKNTERARHEHERELGRIQLAQKQLAAERASVLLSRRSTPLPLQVYTPGR